MGQAGKNVTAGITCRMHQHIAVEMRTLQSVTSICIVAHITSHDVLFVTRGRMASATTAAVRRSVMMMKMAHHHEDDFGVIKGSTEAVSTLQFHISNAMPLGGVRRRR